MGFSTDLTFRSGITRRCWSIAGPITQQRGPCDHGCPSNGFSAHLPILPHVSCDIDGQRQAVQVLCKRRQIHQRITGIIILSSWANAQPSKSRPLLVSVATAATTASLTASREILRAAIWSSCQPHAPIVALRSSRPMPSVAGRREAAGSCGSLELELSPHLLRARHHHRCCSQTPHEHLLSYLREYK